MDNLSIQVISKDKILSIVPLLAKLNCKTPNKILMSRVLEMSNQNYYMPGCRRDCKHAGTNAIGLCLQENKPIQLTGYEHYRVKHHDWTCSSAPIIDNRGDILGVITLSGHSKRRHQHTLALVTAAAEAIETQLRERELIEEKQLLNSLISSIFNLSSNCCWVFLAGQFSKEV